MFLYKCVYGAFIILTSNKKTFTIANITVLVTRYDNVSHNLQYRNFRKNLVILRFILYENTSYVDMNNVAVALVYFYLSTTVKDICILNISSCYKYCYKEKYFFPVRNIYYLS